MTATHAGWRDYAIEGLLLAVFMLSASAFTILVEHPRGLLSAVITDPLLRRFVIGCAMAITAAVLIYSPWGARTGAHMNPAVTLALWRMRGMRPVDVGGYLAGQFAGGIAGMAVAGLLFGSSLSHASVNWVVTRPGPAGTAVAFAAEVLMTLLLMTTVLRLANHPRWAARTGVVTASLLAVFITLEAPLSGMSLNPARSLGPALFANDLTALWIYFIAPPAGMLLAAYVYSARCPHGHCPRGLHAHPVHPAHPVHSVHPAHPLHPRTLRTLRTSAPTHQRTYAPYAPAHPTHPYAPVRTMNGRRNERQI